MKTKQVKTRVICIKCPKCGETIYSRARHDFRYCSCKEVGIDGGFSGYTKITFNKKSPKSFFRYVKATKQELFEDWNKRIDKFGKIV